MKAIEINSKTDKSGHLRIDYKLDISEKKVRVLILLEDEQTESDDPAEDIYSLNDGEPFND